ncbi:diguanylate cyclase [Massilia polaris]|uniref:diguanylate cyclase n=1 Tax=Massilia polaris TaxID=2728846 RepID=UPI00351D3D90
MPCPAHEPANRYLKRVARALDQAAWRTRDLCARLGGEEFVLILLATGEASALNVAERCRKILARENIPHAGAAEAEASLVTVSMGVGTTAPGAHDDAGAFLDMVDRRLYRAKAEGRDRAWSAAA